MTAQPVYDNPDDPVEILRLLPEEYHGQFFDEYEAALDRAHLPERFRELQETLRLWRLRAMAYSSPGYNERLAAAREGNPEEFVPAEHVIPGWPRR